jgi:hypothetical protein
MESDKIIGILGACILAAGVFMPSRFIKLTHYISYFNDNQTNGLILIALALIALLLVYTGSPTKLLLFGLLTLAMVAWAYMRRNPSLQIVENSMSQLAAQAGALPMMRYAALSVVHNTPWWSMLGGSALLVIAGLMQARRA